MGSLAPILSSPPIPIDRCTLHESCALLSCNGGVGSPTGCVTLSTFDFVFRVIAMMVTSASDAVPLHSRVHDHHFNPSH